MCERGAPRVGEARGVRCRLGGTCTSKGVGERRDRCGAGVAW